MNLGNKELDDLLGRWPAPLPERKAESAGQDGGHDGGPPGEQDADRRWEERADAIVKAALASKGEGTSGDALFEAPALAPEPGESGVVFLSGDKKMEQEKDPEPAPTTGETPVPAVTAGETPAPPGAAETPSPSAAKPGAAKRTSLKEMAARASQAGARPSSPGARPSSPGIAGGTPAPPGIAPSSVAPPARDSDVGTPAPPVAKLRPPSTTPLPRPVEAGKDDSGVINLGVVHASATAQQVAAAEKAKPGQAGLFEDDHTVESAVNPAQKPAPAKTPQVAVLAPKKSNTGPLAGAAIAVLGIAAAIAIMSRKPPATNPQPPPVALEAHPTAAAPTTPAPPAPQAAPAPSSVAQADEAPTPQSADPGGKPVEPAARVPGPMPAANAGPNKDTVADAKGAPPSGKPGDLASEMQRAVGGTDAPKPGDAVQPQPASADRNQNIPEQPSQGSVQAAVNSVIGGAKACVAGGDDISRATITFSSNGTVSSVSVSGWAASHGKTGCVQAALKAAKVGAFSKSTFSVPVPIRP